jgi:hypothetical protein
LDSGRNTKKNKYHASVVITTELDDSDPAIRRVVLKIVEEIPLNLSNFASNVNNELDINHIHLIKISASFVERVG